MFLFMGLYDCYDLHGIVPFGQKEEHKMTFDTISRVRELAAERNISLSELARSSGMNHSTLTATKARGGQLQVDSIIRICETLGLSLSEFFSSQNPGTEA